MFGQDSAGSGPPALVKFQPVDVPCLPLSLRQGGTVPLHPPRPVVPDHLYRIGELASRTGLSVRALRHYDAEGLLRPSARTVAGHRLYSAADIERLQRIASLRALGLGLADVRAALDTADLLAVVERHLALVRARIEAQARLAQRLEVLAGHLRLQGTASVEDLFDLITFTTMFEKHYTPEQLQQLNERADAVGTERIAQVQQEWANLFAEFDRHRTAGDAPEDAALRPLVERARALIGEFTGGDAGTRASLNEAIAENRDATASAWSVSPDLNAYYFGAMNAHGGA